ncbi:hypothetical protein Tsubulata_034606 [Turnera subulata]|uniref:RRM domain-containing protein n=1 Tax=Turnera subulata TaxID=218843 RepID=A0A9Q0G561_9ROSI|nr:hypothetical protein Tsubulata_034606 [Turnera subulata]
MGAKAKKALKKKLQKVSSSASQLSKTTSESADFLPIEGGPGRKLPEQKEKKNTATVVYVGRIPHGFYEEEMQAYFSQFGKIKRLRIARNKKTGKSKHYGFIQFEDPEVAEVVADCMHNYLLFEHLLQVYLVPPENVHPKLWKGFNYKFQTVDQVAVERKRMNKERTLDEHRKVLAKIMKRDQKRRRMIEAEGLDYECPAIVRCLFFLFTSIYKLGKLKNSRHKADMRCNLLVSRFGLSFHKYMFEFCDIVQTICALSNKCLLEGYNSVPKKIKFDD